MTEQEESSLCRHCNVSYPKTKEYFYTCRGRLECSRCKECKKKYFRGNRKPDTRINRKPRDRKEYMKQYKLKRNLKKEKELNDSKVK